MEIPLPEPLRPVLTLETAGAGSLGADRVRLLETLGREGSISAAARALGISYKHAWDGIAALNNLAGRPLVEPRKGGAGGGGAALTPAGARFVEAFRRLEAETAERLRRIEAELAEDGIPARMVIGGFLRTSARNALSGTVTAVEEGPVSCRLRIELAPGVGLSAVITRGSLGDLGLFPSRRAIALVKAPFVGIVAPGAATPAGWDRIAARVADVTADAAVAEVALDIGGGKTLIAVVPRDAAPAMGDAVAALIDPGHVILAVD